MRPEANSLHLLRVTRSKAKMYEFSVPEEQHIELFRDPAKLFPLSIGLLGDLAAQINGEEQDQVAQDIQGSLSFSARFFDAYIHAQLNNDLQPYLLLLGSASYYLCDLPGNSTLLAMEIGRECPELEGLGLEHLLLWILQGIFSNEINVPESVYRNSIINIIDHLRQYYSLGTGEQELFAILNHLREAAYKSGTARQLLFSDVICAFIHKRIENSTWYSLPRYTDLSVQQWTEVFRKPSFIKELWPAQHLIGEHNVYRGRSAIIQMPTSAGKTKATEIIIRSSFLSDRTALVVIVAPFRTLCHEIRENLKKAFRRENVFIDELSDVFQIDFVVDRFLERKQILVVTPEKLNYVLHHVPELGSRIGLLVLDEGHQFDNGRRGITYELLITSLKELVSNTAQKILISAVIRNAAQVGHWLSGEGSEIIHGTNLSPTLRSIGFTRWLENFSSILFVNPLNPDEEEFFVPRIIEQYPLQRFSNREKERWFPERADDIVGKELALYLGLKLVIKGSIAIFCGRKDTVQTICQRAVEIFKRQVPLTAPIQFSNRIEINKLLSLISLNLGQDSTSTQCASIGVFAHHSNTPHGIRLAVEYALKEGMIKFIICTSTLAQGVNLPIRYLIVSGTQQGREKISVRDFQNLIGRSGRSGIQTEGSILFPNPEIYESRGDRNGQWQKVKILLNPENSEPCGSTLFSIFDPLKSDSGRYVVVMEPLDLVRQYIHGPEALEIYLEETSEQLKGFSLEGLREQVKYKLRIISAIESFLLSHWTEEDQDEEVIRKLARGTLAYYIGDETQKEQIENLFLTLANNIEQTIPDPAQRKLFGKSLFGIYDALKISSWLEANIENLQSSKSDGEFIDTLWPIFTEMVGNRLLTKCTKPEVIVRITKEWIEGKSFKELFDILDESDARILTEKRPPKYKLDDLIEICENAIAFEGTLVLGAIIDFLELHEGDSIPELLAKLQTLHRKLKYGLDSSHAIVLYECGFADRVVAMDLGSVFEDMDPIKEVIVDSLKRREERVFQVLNEYPSYFSEVYRNLT